MTGLSLHGWVSVNTKLQNVYPAPYINSYSDQFAGAIQANHASGMAARGARSLRGWYARGARTRDARENESE